MRFGISVGSGLLLVVFLLATGCNRKVKKEEGEVKQAEKGPVAQEKSDEKSPDPVAIVDKAIAAGGGLEAMREKLAAWSAESKGSYAGMEYEMTMWWRAPDRVVMNINNGWMAMGYSKDDCWTSMHGIVVDCMADEKAAVPETLGAMHLLNLYPLKDEGVVLEYKGEEEVNNKKAHIVEATVPGSPVPVTFYFDQESGLVVKHRYTSSFMGKRGEQVITVLGYGQFGGITMPSKSIMTFDGKKIMDDELVSVKYGLEDDLVFARPEQAPFGVAGVRTLDKYSALHTLHKGPYESMGASIGKLFMCIGMNDLMPMGGPVMVYLKDPMHTQNPEEYETEVRVPVNPTDATSLRGPGCALKVVPAQQVAIRLEKGPYEQTGKAYGQLAGWAAQNGWEITGPGMMNTYSDPRNTPPEELLNEVYFPVEKKGTDAPADSQ